MKILIDNGHGLGSVNGSPDGRIKEYKYCRELADIVVSELKARGYDAMRIVPEEADIPLPTRVKRINKICDEVGKNNVLLVSLHCDAAGNGSKWNNARGFSARVSTKAGNLSKRLAKSLWDAAIRHGLQGNRSIPGCGYVAQGLYICGETKCPAVLTENLFQDNKEDVEFMLTEEGKREIALANVDGIVDYPKSL